MVNNSTDINKKINNLSPQIIEHKKDLEIPGLYNSYQPPLALASKETFFTRQEKHVTCQINKDTNLYYTTPICIYLWIIINALRQKMLSFLQTSQYITWLLES